LREITAQFHRGRVYAIFGENGAGKSTLLRIAGGLTQPSRGDVLFEAAGEPAKQPIGYMAHASMLYDELSGMENLRYFGGLYGRHDNHRFEDLMQQVGLDAQLTRRVSDYSQGMRQRLSLARAIIHDPEIVLLDEPFSNLDSNSSRHIASLLSEMSASGKCVLVVTHQANLLDGVADESLSITRGQLAAHAQGIAAARNANLQGPVA
jgi:ABC-type multidrug transport system ATPase subunit